MSEIKLVTLNDEPALALGEFLLSEDGETLYVGSGTVQSGTEVIYIGQSPAKIKSVVFSRLKTISASISVNKVKTINIEPISTKINQNLHVNISKESYKNINIEIKEVV